MIKPQNTPSPIQSSIRTDARVGQAARHPYEDPIIGMVRILALLRPSGGLPRDRHPLAIGPAVAVGHREPLVVGVAVPQGEDHDCTPAANSTRAARYSGPCLPGSR